MTSLDNVLDFDLSSTEVARLMTEIRATLERDAKFLSAFAGPLQDGLCIPEWGDECPIEFTITYARNEK